MRVQERDAPGNAVASRLELPGKQTPGVAFHLRISNVVRFGTLYIHRSFFKEAKKERGL